MPELEPDTRTQSGAALAESPVPSPPKGDPDTATAGPSSPGWAAPAVTAKDWSWLGRTVSKGTQASLQGLDVLLRPGWHTMRQGTLK